MTTYDKSATLGLNLPKGTDTFDYDVFLRQNFNTLDVSLTEKAKQADLLAYINAKNRSNQPQRKRYYLYDSFARIVDSNTSLGNCETNNLAYTVLGTNTPVWGIVGGQAYLVSTSAAGRTIAYQETNETDGIIEIKVNPLAPNSGLAFRVVDINNFWFVTVSATNVQLAKYVAGSSTTVGTIGGSWTKPCKLIVKMKGNKIEFFLDGILQAKTYDSFNNTATKHGLYSHADTVGLSGATWDNFCMKPDGEVLTSINDGFEDSTFNWYWTQESGGQPYSLTFNNSVKNSGVQSLRAELNLSDTVGSTGRHRSEIKLPAENPLEEHWYGVSIYLPNGGSEDYTLDTEAEILMQWHANPDSGEDQVSPPLSLQTQNGHYYIQQCWQPNRLSVQQGLPMLFTDIGDYTGDKGKWVNWVFHVKWGWLVDQEPITEVYKNGVLVYQQNGQPNAFNDQSGVYQKIGVYKWAWDDTTTYHSQITKRVVYYDDYWMK